ncbi:mitochondrial 37S ribosomal protein uS13m SWS2 [Sporobolomyces salmoneus]|uniref:mitochondrial 37S ribosomal protein uS13m SWS2 n=1 Tax=Sporobolomyces salmoneus TaxID=183962 RepID=UPI00318089B4
MQECRGGEREGNTLRTPKQLLQPDNMVNLLGATLPDRKLVKIALLAFHGINHQTSSRIMARLQFHDQMRVSDLTEPQMNALSALLSAPAAAPRPSTPLLPFSLSSSSSSSSSDASTSQLTPRDPPSTAQDPIPSLLLEEDLRRSRRADIAHHRTVGTLKGRQHAMGLPVRGQRNKTNAKTAKKLNRIERRGFATSSNGAQNGASYGRSSVLDNLRSLHLSSGRPSLSSVFRS